MSDQIDWDAIGKKIERNLVGARAWTFRPTATVERNQDGSFDITLDWRESYDMAWDQEWNEMEETDNHAIQDEGGHVLDQFLEDNPEFKGQLASRWRPNEGEILYTCEDCGYATESKRGLKIHIGKSHVT